MAFLENVFIEGNAGAILDGPAGTPATQCLSVQGAPGATPIPVSVSGTSTITLAGTQTVTVAGTSTVEVAGIVGTSTVAVAGIVQVAPTTAANTRVNPFFTEITDGTSTMGAMVNFGSNPGAVPALNANVAVQQGTVTLAGTNTVEVAGIVGTSTVTVAAIAGTPTVQVAGISAGTVAVAGTSTVEVAGIVGTSTVTVAGTSTVQVAGISAGTVAVAGTSTVEVAGIVGTSTVTVSAIAGTPTVEVAGVLGTSTVTVAGTATVTVVGGSSSNPAAGPTGSPVPADADYVGFNSGGNLTGVSSATPLPVSDIGTSTTTIAGSTTYMSGVAPGTAPTQTEIVGGVYNNNPPVPTTGQTLANQQDPAGNANVNVRAGVLSSSPNFVYSKAASLTASGTSGTISLGTKPAEGQVVVIVVQFSTAVSAVSCTDSNANSLTAHGSNGSHNLYVFYGFSDATVSGTYTVQWTGTAAATGAISQYSNVSRMIAGGSTSATTTTPIISNNQNQSNSTFVGLFGTPNLETVTALANDGSLRSSNNSNSLTVAIADNTGQLQSNVSVGVTSSGSVLWATFSVELLPPTVMLMGGVYSAVLPGLSVGQGSVLQLDSSSNLKTTIATTVSVGGTTTVAVTGTVTANCTGTQTVEVAGIVGTPTVAIASIVGTPTVAVASIVGTSTVEVAGIVGTSTVQIAGISAGTVQVAGTSTVTISGSISTAGTSTVEVAGIVGTSTVTVAAIAGTSTVAIAGTSTVAVTGQIAGPVAAGAAASSSVLTGYVYNTAAPSLTNAQQVAQQCDSSGNLRVNPFGNIGSFISATASASTTVTGGANVNLTVPANTKWLLKGLTVESIGTGAASSTRGIQVFIKDTLGNVIFTTLAAGGGTASQTATNVLRVVCGPAVANTTTPVGTAGVVNGTTTLVAQLTLSEMVLGPSFTIQPVHYSLATGTNTITVRANVMQISD